MTGQASVQEDVDVGKRTQPSEAQCRCHIRNPTVSGALQHGSKVQLRTLALDATYRYVTDDYDMPEALPPLILLLAHLRDG
jgi:hypothetical protein